MHSNVRNGYIPYGFYDNNDYLTLPSLASSTAVSPQHYRTSINIGTDRSQYIDQTYGTISDNRYQTNYMNPYSRASFSSLQPNINLMNNNNNNHLNMFNTNQRYITTNEQKKSLATHV